MRVANGPNWHDNYGRPRAYYIQWIIRTVPGWGCDVMSPFDHCHVRSRSLTVLLAYVYSVWQRMHYIIACHTRNSGTYFLQLRLQLPCKSLLRLLRWSCIHDRLSSVCWIRFDVTIFFRCFTWYLTNVVHIRRFRHRCLCMSSSLDICGNFQTNPKSQRLSLKEQVHMC